MNSTLLKRHVAEFAVDMKNNPGKHEEDILERKKVAPLIPVYANDEEEEIPAAETTVFKVVRWMPNTEGMF